MKQQVDMIHSLRERTEIIEHEKIDLKELNEQLQAEINSLRRMVSIKDTGEWTSIFSVPVFIFPT